GEDVTSLLRNADMAMYEAKNNGGKQHSFFDQSLQEKALAKIRLDEQLAVAVNHNQFILHYQPIYDLETRNIESYEALIRWNHPESGLVFPDKFIPQAEESGCIKDIGYLVIQASCAFIKKTLARTGYCPSVSVNLSPQQFMDPNLVEYIQQELNKSELDARYLEIEITESSLMENIDLAIETLSELKAIGVSIAIDDFGTGYSSLAMLRRLPVDKLKIDRSFVMEMDDNRSDQRIVRGLIFMAHTLRLKVVAEGIETESQENILRRYGCDLGQGYFFSRPQPEAQLTIPSSEPKPNYTTIT
ncbi:putative bifunctional diguanylate cyclase/phosphodiesterase, partial [Pontibacterium sp.]|uniref:putative bifunctional diguanylate cyclase/phosphodiesterase n=1 Tax=Pontibacterium sp. TaxID=2036026 RepID=UPI00356392C9